MLPFCFSMKKYRILALLIVIIIPLIIIGFYHTFYKIEDTNWINQCTIHRFTGLECPGCGGQRSLHLLLHGDIEQALHYNAFFVISLPFLAYFYIMAVRVYILKQKSCQKSFIFSSWFGFGLLTFVILFFILRNIPVWPFTYLAPPI